MVFSYITNLKVVKIEHFHYFSALHPQRNPVSLSKQNT